MAIGLVLFVAAIPAAAACCVGKDAVAKSVHASMPCCAGSCRLGPANPTRDNDINVVSAPSVSKPVPVIAVATAPQVLPVSFDNATGTPNESSVPPAFLVHHQFRI